MLTQIFNKSVIEEIKKSLRLAIPLILSEWIYATSGFIAAVMTAHLGKDAMAAIALAIAIWNFFIATFIGVLSAVGILVAQQYGAKNKENIRYIFAQGFWFSLICGISIMVVLWFLTPLLCQWSGLAEIITKLTIEATNSVAFCIPSVCLLILCEQLFISLQRSRLVLIVSLSIVPMEIFFNYLFLFGKWGFPMLGVRGFGYTYTAVYTIGTLIFGLFMAFNKFFKDFRFFSAIKTFNLKWFVDLLQTGWPIGLAYGIELGAFLIIAVLMGHFGDDALAAYRISQQYLAFIIVGFFAIAQAATARVGYAVGENDKKTAKLASKITLGIGLVLILFFLFLIVGFGKNLIGVDFDIYNPKYAMVFRYAMQFFFMVGIVEFFDCIRIIKSGALRGLKDTKTPMIASAIGFWCIALPIAYLVAFIFNLGGIGLWIGLAVGIAVSALILQIRFRKLIKKVNFAELIK